MDPICAELFRDIDQDTVDFVDNYDGKLKEPTLLPTSFPNVLVSANKGIAVGMASDLCDFNLGEVCDTTIAYIKNPDCDLMDTLLAPDLPTGGELLYDAAALAAIYQTGRGSFKVRAKWRYIKADNLIEAYEIPYSTTSETIMDKVTELVKAGKIKEITDMRDETDLSGLKLTIDLKRGTDPDLLMAKLFKSTPLMDSQPCNFNILISGRPQVLGVREILQEWTTWRMDCVRRRVSYLLSKKKKSLHLLNGLKRILLDIDKAIKIIRDTEEDADVVPNLMVGFAIDAVQAEYVADIRLRNINKGYILKRLQESDALEQEIADLEDTVNSPKRIKKIIIKELTDVKKKYATPRRTDIIYDYESDSKDIDLDTPPEYPVNVFLSREGYLKKITPLSLRMASEQKYKDGDGLFWQWGTTSNAELLVFTNKQQCYKACLNEFTDTKASSLGEYLPSKLGMGQDEKPLWACLPGDFSGHLLFFFENGKVARVELSAYRTQTKRRKLSNAYSDKSPLVSILFIKEDTELAVISTEGRCLIFHTASLAPKSTRSAQGVAVMTLRRSTQKVERVLPVSETPIVNITRYRAKSLPAVGSLLRGPDRGEEQLSLMD